MIRYTLYKRELQPAHALKPRYKHYFRVMWVKSESNIQYITLKDYMVEMEEVTDISAYLNTLIPERVNPNDDDVILLATDKARKTWAEYISYGYKRVE